MENAPIIEIKQIPATIEEFIAMREQLSVSPEGAAALFLLAFKTFAENPDLGKQFLVACVDKQRLTTGNTYKGFDLLAADLNLMKSQLGYNSVIPNSYIDGTSPTSNYKTQLPYKYIFTSNAYSGNPNESAFKVFVKCSGADSPRPIALRKNDKGIWKASEWSSVLVGIKKPPVTDDI